MISGFITYTSSSQSVALRPIALALSRNVLKIQVLGLHPRLTEMETLEVGPRDPFYQALWVDIQLKLRGHCSGPTIFS